MLEFILILAVLTFLSRIQIGEREISEAYEPSKSKYENGTAEIFMLKNAWEFKSLDDCMEFRELRQTGWRGNAADFYKWKEEEQL